MANICDVCYKIVGDIKQVKEIYKTLQYMEKRKTPVVRNGWGKFWLGCLISKLGGDWEKYTCRGEILDYFYEDDVLTINQETAWAEQEGIRIFLEHKFPEIKIFYSEEEPGFDIYQTNDAEGTYFTDRYFLDSYDLQEYYETIDQAVKDVSEIVGHHVEPTVKAIQEALDEYIKSQEDEDLYYSFHEFTITE